MIPGIMAAQMRVAGGGETPAQAILNNLISWWDFEESSGTDIADAHGGFPLVSSADLSTMTSESGVVGRSTDCTANFRWLSRPDSSTFAFGDESFTVFLWHYPISTEPAVAGIAGKYATTGTERSYEVTRLASTNKFRVNLSNDGTAATSHDGPTKTPTDTAFNLIAFGYNATTNMGFLIVDGVRSEFAHAGGCFSGAASRFGIGGRVDNAGSPGALGRGRHDSAGVMAKAITDAEYAVLYNAGAGLNYAGLVALT